MAKLIKLESGEITKFKPEGAAERDAKYDALIAYAKKVDDALLLADAAEAKISELRELDAWWQANVSVRHGVNRHNVENADLRSLVSLAKAENLSGFKQQQISRIHIGLGDEDKFRARIVSGARRGGHIETAENYRALGTAYNEWYTPAEWLDLAREVLGAIDLDPASSEIAQRTVRAERFFTAEDNGLSEEWHGRVWLNPPYAQPAMSEFVAKLLAECAAGHTTAAVMLTHSYTDAAWCQDAMSAANALCFCRTRVKFLDLAGNKCLPTQGQIFFYYGDQPDTFAEMFGEYGFIASRWQP